MPMEWPARPFDPECKEHRPVDDYMLEAIRKVIGDFDGENLAAVKVRLLANGKIPVESLPTLTIEDIGQIFAQFGDSMLRLDGKAYTTEQTVIRTDFGRIVDDGMREAEYFEQFNIRPGRLRKAAWDGRLERVENRNGNRKYYHEPEVRRLWPGLFM